MQIDKDRYQPSNWPQEKLRRILAHNKPKPGIMADMLFWESVDIDISSHTEIWHGSCAMCQVFAFLSDFIHSWLQNFLQWCMRMSKKDQISNIKGPAKGSNCPTHHLSAQIPWYCSAACNSNSNSFPAIASNATTRGCIHTKSTLAIIQTKNNLHVFFLFVSYPFLPTKYSNKSVW